MEFASILNTICGVALGYLLYLVYDQAAEIGIRMADSMTTGINTARITVINGEVFVDPIE